MSRPTTENPNETGIRPASDSATADTVVVTVMLTQAHIDYLTAFTLSGAFTLADQIVCMIDEASDRSWAEHDAEMAALEKATPPEEAQPF